MQGLNRIINEITADAKKEAEAIILKAKDEIISLEAEYSAKKAIELEKINAFLQDEQQKLLERYKSMGDLTERKLLLKAKQDTIDTAFTHAFEHFLNMDKKQYASLLSELIFKNASGDEELILSSHEDDSFKKEVLNLANDLLLQNGKKGELKLSDEQKKLACGFVLKNGQAYKNFDFSVILSRLRDDFSHKVYEILEN